VAHVTGQRGLTQKCWGTPPRVFCGKRLQTIENKGSEGRKECKETTKRQQADANKRLGMPGGPVEAFGMQKAHLKV